jgi:hypothetical protein
MSIYSILMVTVFSVLGFITGQHFAMPSAISIPVYGRKNGRLREGN